MTNAKVIINQYIEQIHPFLLTRVAGSMLNKSGQNG
jgi:hypothetical protein